MIGVVQISQLSAMFVVVRPFVGRQWRRAGIVTIVGLVLAELVIAAQLPVDLFLALPVGAAIGTAVLLAFGRPDRHPTDRDSWRCGWRIRWRSYEVGLSERTGLGSGIGTWLDRLQLARGFRSLRWTHHVRQVALRRLGPSGQWVSRVDPVMDLANITLWVVAGASLIFWTPDAPR